MDSPTSPVVAAMERNELLCYMQNYMADQSKSVIVTRVCAYYDATVIQSAKTQLFKSVDELKEANSVSSVDYPKFIQRRSSDSKKRLDVEDIFEAFNKLNQLNFILPTYFAVDLSKIPPATATELDVKELTEITENILKAVERSSRVNLESNKILRNLSTAQVNDPLRATITSAGLGQTQATEAETRQPAPGQDQTVLGVTHGKLVFDEFTAAVPVSQGSDSDRIAQPEANLRTYNPSNHHEARPNPWSQLRPVIFQPHQMAPPRATLHGTKAAVNCKIKGVARQARMNLMISRLDKNTSENDLNEYLSEIGIKDATCRRLKSVDDRSGYVFKTAAFFISIDPKYRDLAYNMDNWPEDCLIRDWINKGKEKTIH